MNSEEKIELILNWAKAHPRFDVSYVWSVKDGLEKWGKLTPAQDQALSNIIRKWKIENAEDDEWPETREDMPDERGISLKEILRSDYD